MNTNVEFRVNCVFDMQTETTSHYTIILLYIVIVWQNCPSIQFYRLNRTTFDDLKLERFNIDISA